MAFRSLQFTPGLNAQLTPTLNRAGWVGELINGVPTTNLVRWPQSASGQPEVVGGWIAYLLSGAVLTGVCRGLHAWATLAGLPTLAAGTNSHLYVCQGGVAYDITPSGLAAGPVDEGPATGWGIGTWGTGTWGTPRPQSTVTVPPAIWQMDNWGEDLVAARAPSKIYFWDNPSSPISPPNVSHVALPLTGDAAAGTGLICNGVLVAPQQQQLIAWGCSIPNPATATWGAQDPMVICWSDFSNYSTFFAAATNAAGSWRLNDGSQIMLMLKSQGQMLAWTDTALFSMQFINVPLVYGFQQIGSSCGLISPKAAAVVAGQAFWWSAQNFYTYNGNVLPMPCPVRDLVFNNVNTGQLLKICASTNTEFSEVQWEYPSLSSTENDSYVSYNYINGTWAFGTLANGVPVGRTARIDQNVFGFPIAADASGNLWLHENGYTAGAAAMPWSAQSGFADIAEGEEFTFADQLIPDAVQSGGDIGITVLAQNYPTDRPQTFGPFNAGPDVEYISFRARSRQLAVNFANTNQTVALFWRLGRVRVRAAADGRR